MTAKRIFISWDVDGTLVLGQNGNAIHHRCFCGAVGELFAPVPCDVEEFLGHTVNGSMDAGIVFEILQKLGFEPTPANLARVQARTEALFREAGAVPSVCTGIPETLEYLVGQPNVTIGLASGNFPGVAWAKLEAVGLLKYFPDRIGGLGTMIDRKDAVLAAIAAAEKVTGVTFDVKTHVGDTLADADAAIGAGAIPFLVRTGREPVTEAPEGVTIVDNLLVGKDDFLSRLGLE
jgi:phosphoglycolate phosphatase-like HAD superfamily hydrolase